MKRLVRKLKKHVRASGETPYPSSPQRPPTINLWIKFGEQLEKMQVYAYCARYAASKSLDIALAGREYSDADDMGWHETEDGLMSFRLYGDVDGLLDEEFETDWVPPQPDLNNLLRAAGKIAVAHEASEEEAAPRQVRKPRAAGAPAPSRDGLVSLADICAELKIEPRDARKTLRGKVEKPDAGWAWPAAEATKIKALLK